MKAHCCHSIDAITTATATYYSSEQQKTMPDLASSQQQQHQYYYPGYHHHHHEEKPKEKLQQQQQQAPALAALTSATTTDISNKHPSHLRDALLVKEEDENSNDNVEKAPKRRKTVKREVIKPDPKYKGIFKLIIWYFPMAQCNATFCRIAK